ncbi:capsular polysaccharide biosynthesis protein [Jatrophihabitans sp. GAS493]|uniref:hypothetical protein n=1 Tax=Jatrophihabitans sp. GAS493 TaxID=1907575 RepID=UPI000BB93467|nr:hypothetical protein [Jatrophihabitans sp. GAS493]SOD70295.1 capsular polysaccharide biosynthesis protein [Jatrophihabitans sp. GAS493]
MPHKRVALLLRRWYIVLLALFITAGLVAVAFTQVPATYKATANVLVIPPAGAGANPYLDLGGLNGVGDVLSLNLSSIDAAKILTDEGVTGTYLVATDDSSSAPLITVTATDKSPEGALATMHAVVALLSPRLQQIQQNLNVPNGHFLTIQPVNADDTAKPIRKSQQRAIIAAVGIGVLIGFGMLAGVENLSARRARKRAIEAERQQEAVEAALAAHAAAGDQAETADGAAVDGIAVNGSAVNGTAVNGTAVNGSAVNGSAHNGSAVNGHTNGSHTNGGQNNGSVVGSPIAAPLPAAAPDEGQLGAGAHTADSTATTAVAADRPAKWSLFRRRRRHAAHVAARAEAARLESSDATAADNEASDSTSSGEPVAANGAQSWPAQAISVPEIGYVPVRRRSGSSYERD